MNKKVMAVAVAGVFGLPAVAMAQASSVQIYGRLNLGVDSYEAKGAGPTTNNPGGSTADRDSRWRVFDGSSRVGLRGTEDLGGGLRAIFQIETGVNVDTGNQNGQANTANASSGFWASRDSFVGLDSNWGRVTFGRQSIYWVNGVNNQTGANYVNTDIPWSSGANQGAITTGGTGVARVSNTLAYTSPTFGGVNGTISFSPGGVGGQESVQNVGASTDTDGFILGLTLRGTFGAFYGQFDWVSLSANTVKTAAAPGGTHQQEVTGVKLGLSWGYMPGARIGFIWHRTENNSNFGGAATTVTTGGGSVVAGDEVNQDGWIINWEHTFGNIQALAQYGQLGDMKSCGAGSGGAVTPAAVCQNTKASSFLIGGRYNMSKRTALYLTYQEVDNKQNQFVDYLAGNMTSTAGAPTPYGADPKIFALGLWHQF
jgi:predicted porin